ncbi:MAG: hypothetical protein AVDCRST_MAG17-602, partial [uncultured Solirubrobacterales bacterium]
CRSRRCRRRPSGPCSRECAPGRSSPAPIPPRRVRARCWPPIAAAVAPASTPSRGPGTDTRAPAGPGSSPGASCVRSSRCWRPASGRRRRRRRASSAGRSASTARSASARPVAPSPRPRPKPASRPLVVAAPPRRAIPTARASCATARGGPGCASSAASTTTRRPWRRPGRRRPTAPSARPPWPGRRPT